MYAQTMDVLQKLTILAGAARYDASCASSGSSSAGAGPGVGSRLAAGVCHSFTPDGRCISLLKVLLTNRCVYDCAYCVNRSTNETPRATFGVRQLVDLTLAFYHRNYIEGLFLSSGIFPTPNATMERLVRVLEALRQEHGFRGYVHVKTIPGADPLLVRRAARAADRVSANIELPTDTALARLAPDKRAESIRGAMGLVRASMRELADHPAPPAPAGQSTQMVVGADNASDRTILTTADALYSSYGLKRVYYAAFSPVPGGLQRPPTPLLREHRLYQADWLLRFYGFKLREIPTGPDGLLDLNLDPKTAWALVNRGRFPVDVNRAPKELLLRVPGLGVRSVLRILSARRQGALRVQDLATLRAPLKRMLPFVTCADHTPRQLDRADLRARLLPPAKQLPLPLAGAEA